MNKDINSIKKVLIAVAKDLKALDERLSYIECNFKTFESDFVEDAPIIYNIGTANNNSIEDEIDELFNLIENTKNYE